MLDILVTGSNGQLGSELKALSQAYKNFNFTFTDRNSLDLSKIREIRNYFAAKNFDAIINCAAYTSVDKAESETELADLINHQAVGALAGIAKEKNIKLIHISTDYVFDGKNHRPYTETDLTAPLSMYGKTKLAGELAIFKISPADTVIVRTSWVYSAFGANFVKSMQRLGRERDHLGVVFDQVGTPTWACDLARVLLDILPKINNKKPEIYNFSNEGAASWYDFAKAIFEISKINCNVKAITSAQYPTPAARPHYSLLDKSKIKNTYGITIPYWKDSLAECLKLIEAKK